MLSLQADLPPILSDELRKLTLLRGEMPEENGRLKRTAAQPLTSQLFSLMLCDKGQKPCRIGANYIAAICAICGKRNSIQIMRCDEMRISWQSKNRGCKVLSLPVADPFLPQLRRGPADLPVNCPGFPLIQGKIRKKLYRESLIQCRGNKW